MKREIRSIMKNQKAGFVIPYVYRDLDYIDEIKDKKVSSVHAYCFCDDKLVLVYADKKGTWTPAEIKVSGTFLLA